MFDLTTNTLLTREEGARALTAAGYGMSAATLSTMASRGGGPKFQKFGNRVQYKWGDLMDWAKSRTSTPRFSTSEADLFRKAA